MDIQVTRGAALHGCRMACARVYQGLGWPGLLGLVLMAVAVGLVSPLFMTKAPMRLESSAISVDLTTGPALPVAALGSTPPAVVARRERREVASILTRIGEVSSAAGLGWPAAEYSTLNATETQSAALEVRCTLKGQYPQVRAVLARLLRTIPGLTLRELAISRPHSDTLIVEARVVLAILLSDEALTANASSSEAQ